MRAQCSTCMGDGCSADGCSPRSAARLKRCAGLLTSSSNSSGGGGAGGMLQQLLDAAGEGGRLHARVGRRRQQAVRECPHLPSMCMVLSPQYMPLIQKCSVATASILSTACGAAARQ